MNKKTKIIGFVIIILVLGALVISSTGSNKDLTIGLISGLSGKYAVVGESFVNGAILAKEQYEKENPSNTINLIVEDDGFEEKRGVAAYYKLTDINKVDALLNLSSPTINAIYSQVVNKEIPVIQLGVQAIDPAKDNVFQITPGANASKEALGMKVRAATSGEGAVFVYENMSSILVFADAFKKGFGSGDLSEYKLDPTNKDVIRLVATEIVSEKPEVVAIIATPEMGALLVKQIITISSKVPVFAFDSQIQAGVGDYERILGDLSVLDGSIVQAIKVFPQDEFKKDYKERFGEEPGFGADFGYDSFNLLMNTYNKKFSVWKDNIQKSEMVGVTGGIKFDNVGVREEDVFITSMRDGAILQ